eukprot:1137056-Pelagomonas_calceolata.AAC.7
MEEQVRAGRHHEARGGMLCNVRGAGACRWSAQRPWRRLPFVMEEQVDVSSQNDRLGRTQGFGVFSRHSIVMEEIEGLGVSQ